MKTILFILGTLFSLILGNEKSNIRLVIDVIRHGARGPGTNNPLFPEIQWKFPSELTPLGERQHYLLGRLRRKQYIEENKLLPEIFDPSLVYFRSSDVRRTIMSAQAYILGLYPYGLSELNPKQISDKMDLLLPPIKLTISKEISNLLNSKATPFNIPAPYIKIVEHESEKTLFTSGCPFIKEQEDKFFNSEKYSSLILHKYIKTWEFIMSEYKQVKLTYLLEKANAYGLADFFICAAREGRAPSKINSTIIEELQKFIGDIQKGEFNEHPMQNKIEMSYFTKEVSEFMQNIIENKPSPKYILYSAHDVTEVIILLGLNKINSTINFEKVPDFASNILFELIENTDKTYEIIIYYNGNIIHKENYSDFITKFKELGNMGMSWEEACKISKNNNLRNR